jgi:isopentenyl-diphosphate delta-isomerase
MQPIGSRKTDHLNLCATGAVGFRSRTTMLEQVQLVHDALPDLSWDDLDTSCSLLGKTLRAPIVIAAMTGGTDEARDINRTLATIAEERGYAFALGSQRAMLVKSASAPTYQVRDVAPSAVVLGNLGVVQARGMSTGVVQELVDSVGADALCIHLNPAMELVQPGGGDRDFRGGLDTIARLSRELRVPVIVKETGCGLSARVGERVHGVGVRHVDVSGAGGTSWVGVEQRRAVTAGDAEASALGEAIWDWGIPTAASVAMLARVGFDAIIATGGVATGLDVARAIALGATAGGIARPVLQALRSGGRAGAVAFFERVEHELRAVMLLTGSRDLAALRRAPRVIASELASWITPTTCTE